MSSMVKSGGRLQEILDELMDGLWTVEEAEGKYIRAGGSRKDFIRFANRNKGELCNPEQCDGQPWPYPAT